MGNRRLVVVSAGLGSPSATRLLGERLARSTERGIVGTGERVEVEFVELKPLATDLANHLSGLLGPRLAEAMDRVTEADGLIVVSPIFNASYSGLFKMFIDSLDGDALEGKPVLVAATAGSARHALVLEHALRPLFVYLKAIVAPTAVLAASEDWGSGESEAGEQLVSRIDRASSELARLMVSIPAHRESDPYANPTTFAEMFAAVGGGSVRGGDVDVVGVVDEVGPGLSVER